MLTGTEVVAPDFLVQNEGTIFLVKPQNDNATQWLAEHTKGLWFGKALCVEHRFVGDLIAGIEGEGFTVA